MTSFSFLHENVSFPFQDVRYNDLLQGKLLLLWQCRAGTWIIHHYDLFYQKNPEIAKLVFSWAQVGPMQMISYLISLMDKAIIPDDRCKSIL